MSRKKKNAKQRRKIIAQRSAEARKKERTRSYVGKIPELSLKALGRLTGEQLADVAGTVGRIFQLKQRQLHELDELPFDGVPRINLTKYERELIKRPDITDEQIAQAPSKRRKTMRQQQRRRRDAKAKMERMRQYDAIASQEYTRGEIREMEQRGESPYDVLGGMGVHETPIEHFLRTRTAEPLLNRKYMRMKSGEGRRMSVIQDILEYARAAGMKIVGMFRRPSKTYDMENVNAYRDRVNMKITAFDEKLGQRFANLSDRQVRYLISGTNFAQLVDESTHYDRNEGKYVTNASRMPDVESMLSDHMSAAERR